MSKLFLCFDQQLKQIRQEIIDSFDKELRKGSKRDQVNENFSFITRDLMQRHFSNFKKRTEDLIIEGSGWNE